MTTKVKKKTKKKVKRKTFESSYGRTIDSNISSLKSARRICSGGSTTRVNYEFCNDLIQTLEWYRDRVKELEGG